MTTVDPSLAGDASRWFAVHTLPNREPIAMVHLERQGFETFLPKATTTRRHARRFETLKAPLFPRYGFVRLDLERQRWRSVNGTIGVSGLVMGRDRPQPVPEGVVEKLIAASDREGLIDFDRGLRPGDPVTITVGPFAGAVGTLVRLDANGRVEMLLALLAGSVRLTVDREALRSAG